jgi:hypothetical protein
MTKKYINKEWIDTKMKYDPLYLFENKRAKFDKWLRKRMGVVEETQSNDEDEPEKEIKKPVVNVKSVGAPIPQPKP